ncbi:hypothetical protein [Halobacteriovorax sp. HLS]|uniref:hypothetical protein n=1 Tax=Halobacteriovorax sp. HLS TaxID=2234000 RepID=UPI000FD8D241|nr:hypothetical protein [Halobacteriovorax sp. HLS]
MKLLKSLILFSLLISSSMSQAKSPHDSDNSYIDTEITHGKILAAEYNHLSREISRLEAKLNRALTALPDHLEINEGRIVALISNEVERELEVLKKEIEQLSYNSSSNSLYKKIEEIEKDIDMI